jgi:predicted  nucleic acid-binding Zn-ribbon protein
MEKTIPSNEIKPSIPESRQGHMIDADIIEVKKAIANLLNKLKEFQDEKDAIDAQIVNPDKSETSDQIEIEINTLLTNKTEERKEHLDKMIKIYKEQLKTKEDQLTRLHEEKKSIQ